MYDRIKDSADICPQVLNVRNQSRNLNENAEKYVVDDGKYPFSNKLDNKWQEWNFLLSQPKHIKYKLFQVPFNENS